METEKNEIEHYEIQEIRDEYERKVRKNNMEIKKTQHIKTYIQIYFSLLGVREFGVMEMLRDFFSTFSVLKDHSFSSD